MPRQRLNLAPISAREVLDSPALRGMASFLLESAPTTVETTTVDRPTVATNTVQPPVVKATGVVGGWVTPKGVHYETRRTFEIKLVQDSLTLAEESAYNMLWRQVDYGPFKVLSANSRVKVFEGGYDILAEILRMNEKSIRGRVIPVLVEKFAMRRVHHGGSDKGQKLQRSVYELYAYSEILAKQKEAGYTRAIRNGRSIEIVRPTGVDATTVETPTVVATTIDVPTQTVGLRPTVTVGVSSLHSLEYLSRQTLRTSDDAVGSIERQMLGTEWPLDRSAIARVWRQSREAVPDITPEEVVELLLPQLRAKALGGATNATGLALTLWEDYCTPARIEQLRSDRERIRRVNQTSLDDLPPDAIEFARRKGFL